MTDVPPPLPRRIRVRGAQRRAVEMERRFLLIYLYYLSVPCRFTERSSGRSRNVGLLVVVRYDVPEDFAVSVICREFMRKVGKYIPVIKKKELVIKNSIAYNLQD